jgi:hypothetical protein
MTTRWQTRRSKLTAARIFILLFVILVVGSYFTLGTNVIGLGPLWSIILILAALCVGIALLFVK